ncbi:MAG: Fic family protein [Planctomycetota bacterium]
MFDLETIVQYVYHSNRLDGISLTETDTRRILGNSASFDPDAELIGEDGRTFEAEVVLGHDRALRGMSLAASAEKPISEEQLMLLHRTLMGNLLLSAGEYRECILRYKGLLIASPPEHLKERMAWLVNLINTGLERAQDPHKFSWRIHHEFITLHPFIEANGRMARLLLNLCRIRRGLDLTVISFENREAYSRAIIEFQQQKILRAREKANEAPAAE